MTSDVQILQNILRSIKQYYDPQKNLVSVRPGDPIFNEPAGGESSPLPGPNPTFISQAPEEELGFLDKALMRLYGQDENQYREGLALARLKGERQKEELKGLEGKDVLGGFDPTGHDPTVLGPPGVAEQLIGQFNKGVELATAFGGDVGTQVKFGSGAKPTTELGGSASAHALQEMRSGAAPAGRPRPLDVDALKKELSPGAKELGPTIKRASDFSESGNYDVSVGGKKHQIFRDPENGFWYLDPASDLIADKHFSRRLLGFNKKEAFDRVVKLSGATSAQKDAPDRTEPKLERQPKNVEALIPQSDLTEFKVTMSEPEPPNAGPDWYPKEVEVGTVIALNEKKAYEIARKKFGQGAAIAGEIDALNKELSPGFDRAVEDELAAAKNTWPPQAPADMEAYRRSLIMSERIKNVLDQFAERIKPIVERYAPEEGVNLSEVPVMRNPGEQGVASYNPPRKGPYEKGRVYWNDQKILQQILKGNQDYALDTFLHELTHPARRHGAVGEVDMLSPERRAYISPEPGKVIDLPISEMDVHPKTGEVEHTFNNMRKKAAYGSPEEFGFETRYEAARNSEAYNKLKSLTWETIKKLLAGELE